MEDNMQKESNDWDAKKYHKHADFVSNLAMPVIALLNPQKGEKILDVGCGEGTLAIEIEKSGAKVVAVDLSEDMVLKSQEKGLEAYVMSATDLQFDQTFDAIFSNATLHWVLTPEKALKQMYKALKPKGRIVAEFGGKNNIKHLLNAIIAVFEKHPEYGVFQNPWYFPTQDSYQRLLEEYGFEVVRIETIVRPTKIDDITNWLDIFANGIIENLTSEQQVLFKAEVKTLLKPILYSKEEGWVVDYERLRFKAIKI